MVQTVTHYKCEICGKDTHETHEAARLCELRHRFGCKVCGKKYKTQDEAQQCRAKGYPDFAFEIGGFIPELNSRIADRLVKLNRGNHVAFYQLEREPGIWEIFGRSEVDEKRILDFIKKSRTCAICDSEFPNAAQARECENLGIPDFRWNWNNKIPQLNLRVRSCNVILGPDGKHIPNYTVVELLTDQIYEIPEHELLAKF
jgi:hypothetical protein